MIQTIEVHIQIETSGDLWRAHCGPSCRFLEVPRGHSPEWRPTWAWCRLPAIKAKGPVTLRIDESGSPLRCDLCRMATCDGRTGQDEPIPDTVRAPSYEPAPEEED